MTEPQVDVYETRRLFGGDVVCQMPRNFIDVSSQYLKYNKNPFVGRNSQIRQIPENQECFIERDGFTSIIFDILERVGKPGSGAEIDGVALTEHIQDIVGEEESQNLRLWNTTETKITRLSSSIPAYTCIATTPQEDSKKGSSSSSSASSGGKQPANLVFTALILTLIRLEKTNTDIVITINVPHIKGEYDEADVDLELGNRGRLIGNAVEHAAKIWESLRIKNMGLFGKEYEGLDYDEL
ncbi:Ran-interacting Mog1 protein [Zalerion maritima]|uniref:Ran-interacting Mog1 protein n=1 Tax=Zalerion maritima TaxID=339359 RepID=A0AAD5WQD4_9PEZI|nr:Ran-interacting Mog1 protein [Zalerion maritima]